MDMQESCFLINWFIPAMYTCHVVPSSPPNDVTVTLQSSSVVFITWSAPDKSHQNGVIQHYILSLLEEETGWLREETSPGTNVTIAHLHPSFTYTMNISAVTIGIGAKLTLSFQMPEDGKQSMDLYFC